MNSSVDTREIFTRYWLAKLAVQMRYPEMTVESLDSIAKSFASQDETQPKVEHAPKGAKKASGNGPKPKTYSKWTTREYLEHVVGQFPMKVSEIFDALVKEGWQPGPSKKPLSALVTVIRRCPFITRVKAGVYSKKQQKPEKQKPKKQKPEKQTFAQRQKNAAEGRRAVADGVRPPIRDAIEKVLGAEVLNIETIYSKLCARHWAPTSSEPRQYVAYLLATTKDKFERVPSMGRGFYRNARTKKALVEAKSETKAEAPEAGVAA